MDKYNRTDRVFLCILALLHVLFFLLTFHFKKIYNGDSFEYIYEAVNIKANFFFYSGNPGLPIIPEYMTQRQPGYPLFLFIIYLFAANNWIVLVFQNLLSIFNIYYFRRSISRLGYQEKYDWLLLLLILAYPIQFIYANTIAPDLLLQTFVLIYFHQFILLLQQKDKKYAVGMSVALILGLFVKPVLYPFVFLHIIILLMVAASQKIRMQCMVIIAIIPLCAVLCYNYWNYNRTGKFHFSSNTAFNAVYYYYDYFRDRQGLDSAERFLQKERNDIATIPEYKDRYDYANERGTQLLKENFAPYMLYHLQNSSRIFIEPGKSEIDLFTGGLTYGKLYSKKRSGFYATLKDKGWGGLPGYIRNNPSMPFVIIILLFNFIRLAGLFIFFFSKRIDIMARVFVFILLCYFAVAAGPIANTHYFLPVSLIAIGCAVTGYQQLFQNQTKVLQN